MIQDFQGYVIGFRDARQLDCETFKSMVGNSPPAKKMNQAICHFAGSAEAILHQTAAYQVLTLENKCRKDPTADFRRVLIEMLIEGKA